MLYHHDSRDYDTAAAAAAEKARATMDSLIAKGRSSALAVMEHAHTAIPTDRIVPARALQFLPAAEGVQVAYRDGKAPAVDNGELAALLRRPLGSGSSAERISKNAFGQICERAGMPVPFARELNGSDWGRELLAHNFNQLFSHIPAKYLARSFEGMIKALLTDAYRRLDSRPLLDSFGMACHEIGAIPVDGHISETRIAIKAVLPQIFEPVMNEPMLFGLQWQNSDFGNGAHEVRAFCLRLWCTNTATMEDVMRQVHLGKRLTEDFKFSQKTYELDTAAAASALGDVVRGSLGKEAIEQKIAVVKHAHEMKIDVKAAEAQLKKAIGTEDTIRVLEAFRSPDVEMMPAGNTQWRLSNAVSWIAGQTKDEDRKLDLQRFAGQLLAA